MKEFYVLKCNVNLRKLLRAHKSHVRETSLFTGAIPNPVRHSQTSRFVSVPGQYPERSSRGDSVLLRLQAGMLILVLVLKDSLRTFFKSFSWWVRSLSLSWSLWSSPCPCPCF